MFGAVVVMLAAVMPMGGDDVLPVGDAPQPVEFAHFPDRLHAFVWRNWTLVEPQRLARVLDTSVENVQAVGESMGLPPPASIPPEAKTRGYITLLRRNWHLLPYEQILVLLDTSAEQLAHALREDDFLFYKLGAHKPACEPLKYVPPDEAARRRAAKIKSVVQETFGEEMRGPEEPRFQFVRDLSLEKGTVPISPREGVSPRFPKAGNGDRPRRNGDSSRAPAAAGTAALPPASPAAASGTAAAPAASGTAASPAASGTDLRFIYSYFALYGDPLMTPELDPFPDGLLEKLAGLGINGVWMHVVLRQLAPSRVFPEFGEGHEVRLANLRRLVERARRYGIGIFLYLNEPRAMPVRFFDGRGQLKGVQEGDFAALCTSTPEVRAWLVDSLRSVFENVPDLAGVFTITASENLTNCASHGRSAECPRCKERPAAQIIAEVNQAVESGVHGANPHAKVIVWDWGWDDKWAPAVIADLPPTCWLMSVSEWSLPITRGGVSTEVGEYSISAVGPGPRASRHWKLARQAGLRTVAKVQVNNTWEMSAVPYLPVPDLIAEHCRNLASAGVDGLMLSWTLGGYPSPNLHVVQQFSRRPVPDTETVLNALAVKRFGSEGAPHARAAWRAFSSAFREFPFNVSVVYQCPAQYGPSNLLFARPSGYRATMVGFPYDDVDRWRGPYPADVFADQFAKVAAGWKAGLADLQDAIEKAPPERSAEARSELTFATAAQLHFQTVAHQARFTVARNALLARDAPPDAAQRRALIAKTRQIVHAEIEVARALFTLARRDSRIGYEASNHYYYLPIDLVEKVVNCRWVLEQGWLAE